MADAVDRGSLAPEELEHEPDESLGDERGLPDSASNYAPLPLEAIDTVVNKAEGDHEALETNAAQLKAVKDAGLEFNGLTSVEEALQGDLREDIRAEAPDARFGEEANSEAGAPSESSEVDATDSARELAAERGVDLASVEGTGADGRVTKADVEAHSA